MTTITIGGRFNGPPGSGNGGYSAGLLATRLGGPMEVTLLAPPPLDTPMDVERDNGRVRLLRQQQLVAEGVFSTVKLKPPATVSIEQAQRASAAYAGFAQHAFPTCFVCGPQRAERDGLGIFAGKVPGTAVVAAPWTPSAEFADDFGKVDDVLVWAALDCPSYFGSTAGERAVLGRIAVDIRSPLRAGTTYVVLGWGEGADGRKHPAGSAVLDDDGRLYAVARSLWIEPRQQS